MEKQTPIPFEIKDEAAQKPKRAIFSPLICGGWGIQIFHLFCPRLKLSEALWGQLWGEPGKENEEELATTSLEFEFPLQERGEVVTSRCHDS